MDYMKRECVDGLEKFEILLVDDKYQEGNPMAGLKKIAFEGELVFKTEDFTPAPAHYGVYIARSYRNRMKKLYEDFQEMDLDACMMEEKHEIKSRISLYKTRAGSYLLFNSMEFSILPSSQVAQNNYLVAETKDKNQIIRLAMECMISSDVEKLLKLLAEDVRYID